MRLAAWRSFLIFHKNFCIIYIQGKEKTKHFRCFEIIEINFRPVLIEGELEASYPSSHTMLSIGIMTTAIFELHELIKNKKALLIIFDVASIAVAPTVLLGRLLSGVHWLTDLVGGLLLSAALVALYGAVLEQIKEQNSRWQ